MNNLHLKFHLIFFFFGTFFNAAAQDIKNKAFDVLLNQTLHKTVATISVKTLANELATANPPLLLDARERKEFDVSRLKNAQWIGYDTFSIKSLRSIPKDRAIVVYCSIGVRSEKIGEKLKAAGFSNVRNLYGSIFEWSNQGYPLYDAKNKPTKRVHAYDRLWGVWLTEGEKVY